MNHLNRTWGFLGLLGVIASHVLEQGATAAGWAGLLAIYVVYPQLAYLRARDAAQPLQAEIRHFHLDSLFYGLTSGALGFPLWISFVLLLAGLVNLTGFRGVRGGLQALGVFCLGGLVASALAGGPLHLATSLRTSLLAALCVSVYMVVSNHEAWRRSLQLHDARDALRRQEQTLQQQLADNQALQERLNDMAHRDPLTGLFNRRALDTALERELARCQRERQPLALMLLDIDHFKAINDALGHAAGDAVLRQVGRGLAGAVRGGDLACRWGGEEFLLMLPGLGREAAASRAEACRRLVQAGSGAAPTISLGVALFPDDGETPDQLLRQADRALYAAKAAGRDRVVFAAALAPRPDPRPTVEA